MSCLATSFATNFATSFAPVSCFACTTSLDTGHFGSDVHVSILTRGFIFVKHLLCFQRIYLNRVFVSSNTTESNGAAELYV